MTIIYDYYLHGYGIKKIVNELYRLERRDSSGNVKWDVSKVNRILKNATYKGYIGYNKSSTNNYLEQRGKTIMTPQPTFITRVISSRSSAKHSGTSVHGL